MRLGQRFESARRLSQIGVDKPNSRRNEAPEEDAGGFAVDPERPEEIICVVSFDREGTTERAEYAAEVADGWQGRGLGLALTRRLMEAALKRDVRTCTAIVLPENCKMLHLLRDLGLPERVRYDDEDGTDYVEIDLSSPQDASHRTAGVSGPQG